MENTEQNKRIIEQIPKMIMAFIPESSKEKFQALVVDYIKTQYPDLYQLAEENLSAETKAKIQAAIKSGIAALKAKLA